MSIEFGFVGLLVYLLVFARLAGMLLFNPIFGRVSVPMMARMGLILFLTLLVAPMQPLAPVMAMGDLEYVLAVVKEVFIGFAYGYAFQIFFYMLFFVGDLMDTDFGIQMAKNFDPATNIQTSFSSGLITLVFILYIFATNSHLTLIHIFADSFNKIPIGTNALTVSVVSFVLDLFVAVFLLALRLLAPFMVAEFILQASMGILMKFIPQISVFVINFQLRVMLGILMLFLFAPFIAQFIDNYITVLFDNLTDLGSLIGTLA